MTSTRMLAAALLFAAPALAAPTAAYNEAKEKAKGATLEVLTGDRTQKMEVVAPKATVGGIPARFRVVGRAAGGGDANFWLSIFRYQRPDGSVNHVSGVNVAVRTRAGATALDTAKALVDLFKTYRRPYVATAQREGAGALVTIYYRDNERPR